MHNFSGRPSEAIEKAREWALKNVADNNNAITIHEGTQDEFTYVISNGSVKEFFEGSALKNAKPYEIAGYLSVIKDIHRVVENCVETEVHPDYIEKDKDGNRKPDGKTSFDVLIHEYRGVVNVDGQPFHIKLIFKETRDPKKNNPLYAYNLETTELSGVTSEERSEELVTPTLYAPDSSISGAKLWKGFEKSYDSGKLLLNESPKTPETSSTAGDVGVSGDAVSVNTQAGESKPSFSITPTFYSNAEHAAKAIKQDKAKAEQWKAMLTKQGGIKAGEDKWMGLSQWLDEQQGRTLTKAEVLQFIRDNGVQMEETHYQGSLTAEQQQRFDALDEEFESIKDNLDRFYYEADNRYGNFMDEMRDKYGDEWEYMMTDSESATETRLSEEREKLEPHSRDDSEVAFDIMRERYGDDFEQGFFVDSEGNLTIAGDMDRTTSDAALYYLGGEKESNPINSTRLDLTTEGLEDKREIAFVVPNVEPYQETDSIHFGPENQGRAVMWVRFGTATDADGKRVLVIDEVQSNRHQDAREKGYKKSIADYRKEGFRVERNASNNGNILFDRDGNFVAVIDDYDLKGIPAAPFEKNWHEVAMKRMLRYAAENGYDRVAWTTGKQQTERYGLGGKIDSIYIGQSRNSADKYSVMAFDKDANVIHPATGDFPP